ncbi:GGDEF domain-containing protein [Rhizobium sp. RU36D]|uniref:GGDEF domain-containing protein n=1 Tax=Rhizobium sp. RU36D TaxID=1907415 RepID=UPI00117B185E|nr:GGDEF domain-containing protein [Rhizobium sp. RU36D]
MAGLFLFIWSNDRSQRLFLFWGIGFLTHATGSALMGMRDFAPEVISGLLAVSILLSSFFFLVTGLRHCDGRQPAGWAAIPLLLWIAAISVPDIRAVFALKLAVYGLAAATGYLLLALTALTGRFSSTRYRRALAVIWTIQAMNSGSLMVAALVHAPQGLKDMAQGPIYGMIGMACFVAMLVVGAKIVQDQSESKLRRLIARDPLTGALNRRGLTEALPEFRAEIPEGNLVALVIFDLDHFKTINDSYGHQAGDQVLVEYSRRCAAMLRSSGLFCRSGGEEFIGVIHAGSDQEAAQLAESIRRRIAETPFQTDAGSLKVTMSLGIATTSADLFDLEVLMKQADKALYVAKEAGRNRSAIFRDDKIQIVKTASPEHLAQEVDDQADRQVAVLRRITEFAIAAKTRSTR